MFKFLFKQRHPRATNITKKQPQPAQITNSIPLTDSLSCLQSLELEDNHYCHFADSEHLTSDKLSTEKLAFIQSIKEMINSDISLEDEIPRLPDLLPQLLKMLRSDDVSWKSVVDVITQDSVLVAGIIKVANSPFYRLSTKAENLQQVVVYLGQKGVREAVTSVALKPIMQLKGNKNLQQCARRLWDHSLKSAIASRAMADTFKVNGYDAYLAGLIHNVGMTVILKKLASTPGLDEFPCSHLFKAQVTELSRQLSAKIIKSWNMPQATINAVTDQLKGESFSKLGEVLFYGKSIGAHHTLLNSEIWQHRFNHSIEQQQLISHEFIEQLFSELNQLEMPLPAA